MNEEILFKSDPWEGIVKGSYPLKARSLYAKDDRFMVSTDDRGRRLFLVKDILCLPQNLPDKLFGLELNYTETTPNKLECFLDDEQLQHQFIIVAKDLAYCCSSLKGEEFFNEFFKVLYSWSAFLKPSRQGLGWRKYLGFVGELFQLRELLKFLPPAECIDSWNGPDNKKQDFAFGDFSVEVKSSASGDSNEVIISSLEQLQSTVPNLLLNVLRFQEDLLTEGEFTLEQLYKDIEDEIKCDFVAAREFAKKASKLYSKASREELLKPMVLVEQTLYKVKDNFPRLTPESINQPGVLSVNYRINLNSAVDYIVDKTLQEIISNE
jgi:hypothetical protein